MRRLLGSVLLIAAAIVGLWIVAENWAAGRLRDLIADRPEMQAAAVQPLRAPSRIGLRLDRPEIRQPGMGLSPDWLELWLSPLSPLTAVAVPAGDGWLDLSGQRLPYTLADTRAQVALSPLNRMAVSHLALNGGPLNIDGQVLLNRLQAQADLDGISPEGAAYDLHLMLDGLQGYRLALLGLAPLALPGVLSVEGDGRVWLDRALGGQEGGEMPRLLGFATTGIEVRLGDLSARLIGRVRQGGDGRAEGRVALYTPDAEGFIQAAATSGLIPEDGQMLARAMLKQMNRMPMPAALTPDGLDFPDPAATETRIPLVFRDGQMFLGVMPVGPAPRFPG